VRHVDAKLRVDRDDAVRITSEARAFDADVVRVGHPGGRDEQPLGAHDLFPAAAPGLDLDI